MKRFNSMFIVYYKISKSMLQNTIWKQNKIFVFFVKVFLRDSISQKLDKISTEAWTHIMSNVLEINQYLRSVMDWPLRIKMWMNAYLTLSMRSKFLRMQEIQKRCKGPTYKKIAGCLRYSFKLRIKSSRHEAFVESPFLPECDRLAQTH